MANLSSIYALAKKLNLYNLAKGEIDLSDEKCSNLEYLEAVLEAEVTLRNAAAAEKREQMSRLPKKYFDKERVGDGLLWHVEQLEQLRWLREGQNLVFIGKCSSGKTSLAAHLARLCLVREDKVFYCTVDEFLYILRYKDRKDKQARQYRYITNCELVILDDVMNVPIAAEDLPALYRALTFLNETRSFIVITNRELSGWVDAAEDTHLMQTVVDRLTANSQILRFS